MHDIKTEWGHSVFIGSKTKTKRKKCYQMKLVDYLDQIR